MKKAKNILGKALVFEAGPSTWAAELNRIKEVVRAEQIAPLPNSSPRIAGIISVRGEVIPVLSKGWHGGSSDDSHDENAAASILLLQSREDTIGVAVGHVRGIEDIQAYDLGSMTGVDDRLKNLVSCSIMVSDSGSVPLLDAKLIVEYLKSAGSLDHADDNAVSG